MQNSLVSPQPQLYPQPWKSPELAAFGAQELMSIVLRRFPLFLILFALIMAAVTTVTLTQKPLYTAGVDVMINSRKEQVLNSQAVLSPLDADNTIMDTEVEVLKSRHLADRVVQTLHLDADPEFNFKLRPPGMLSSTKMTLLRLFSKPSAGSASSGAQEAHQEVVNAVMHRTAVRRDGLTLVMDIQFTSDSALKSAQIANAFADLYLTEQMETKHDATRQANALLSERLTELSAEVEKAAATASNYRIEHGLLGAEGQTLSEQEISSYNQELAASSTALAEKQARLNTAKQLQESGGAGDDAIPILGSDLLQTLRTERSEIASRLANLKSRYGDRYPEVLMAQGQLAEKSAQIRSEINRIVPSLQAQVQIDQSRTKALEFRLAQARGMLATNSAASVRASELDHDAESVRNAYQTTLDRFRQTSAQAGTEQPDARIVSTASPPDKPQSPKVALQLLLGALLAAATGSAATILAELADPGLSAAADLERKLGVPHIGTVPLLASIAEASDRGEQPIDYVLKRPLSAFSEAFRSLRVSIRESAANQSSMIVAVTSTEPNEGKSTTALCLARVAAQSGTKVLLIDCDLRRRAVSQMLRMSADSGLVEVLNGTSSLESALMVDKASGVIVMPISEKELTPQDIFGSPAMERLLAYARSNFDLVILDTPPMLAVTDTRSIANLCDTVLFLVRWRKTSSVAATEALQLLRQTGANVAGAVLSQVDLRLEAGNKYRFAAYPEYYKIDSGVQELMR